MGRPRQKTVKDAESGAHALLTAIWNHFGGPQAVAEKCGVKFRDIVNWEVRGKVSLEYVAHIAEKLDFNFCAAYEALNYIDVSLANRPYNRTPWNEVVCAICAHLGLSTKLRDQILFLEPPKLPKLYKKH